MAAEVRDVAADGGLAARTSRRSPRDVRAGLLRRPHLTVLLTSRSGRGAADLVLLDRTLGVLRAAGFDRRTAVLVNHALGNYVAGVALWEAVGLGGTTGEARAERRREAAEAVARAPGRRVPERVVGRRRARRGERGRPVRVRPRSGSSTGWLRQAPSPRPRRAARDRLRGLAAGATGIGQSQARRHAAPGLQREA